MLAWEKSKISIIVSPGKTFIAEVWSVEEYTDLNKYEKCRGEHKNSWKKIRVIRKGQESQSQFTERFWRMS